MHNYVSLIMSDNTSTGEHQSGSQDMFTESDHGKVSSSLAGMQAICDILETVVHITV